jgi:hypothetical protein
MSASDELLTIAELAIGLAGFSGVVVAFAYRGQLEAIDRMRFIALFSTAISTAIFAFLPFVFARGGFSEATTWRCSSALLLTWSIVLGIPIGSRLRRAALDRGAAARRALIFALWGLAILNMLLQLLNAIGSPSTPGPLPYVGGLLILIVFAAVFFAFLVLFRPKEPAA